MKQTAIITAIGSFSADIAIKTLKDMAFTVIGCDIYPEEWIADSKNVDFFYQAPYVSDKEEYLNFLHNICKQHNASYILPSTDIEVDLLCDYKEAFKAHGTTVCTSDADIIHQIRNKLTLPDYLAMYKPDIPDTISLIPTQSINNADLGSIGYPLVLKPSDGRSSEGCHIIKNAEDLHYFSSNYTGRDMLLQPYISGAVITVDVVCDGSQTVCAARRELLRTKNGAGTSVEIIENNDLSNFCNIVCLNLGIIGAVNFEFIEADNDRYYFLEINPRLSGGVEFSHLAGLNVVKQHMNIFMGKPVDTKFSIKKLIIARKYEEYIMN